MTRVHPTNLKAIEQPITLAQALRLMFGCFNISGVDMCCFNKQSNTACSIWFAATVLFLCNWLQGILPTILAYKVQLKQVTTCLLIAKFNTCVWSPVRASGPLHTSTTRQRTHLHPVSADVAARSATHRKARQAAHSTTHAVTRDVATSPHAQSSHL